MSGTGGGPLAGIRVIDLAGLPAAYGTMLLAGLGADVVKVEPPEGDPLRHQAPFLERAEPPENSLWFAYLGQGKRSVVVRDDGELERLLAGADAVVDSSPPGRARRAARPPPRAGMGGHHAVRARRPLPRPPRHQPHRLGVLRRALRDRLPRPPAGRAGRPGAAGVPTHRPARHRCPAPGPARPSPGPRRPGPAGRHLGAGVLPGHGAGDGAAAVPRRPRPPRPARQPPGGHPAVRPLPLQGRPRQLPRAWGRPTGTPWPAGSTR